MDMKASCGGSCAFDDERLRREEPPPLADMTDVDVLALKALNALVEGADASFA